MATSTKQRRLDDIEVQLTPKEWAIRLAAEMRKHPRQEGFWKAITKGTYRDSLIVKPFFKLAEQAEAHHPGNSPEDIHARNQLNRKLRTEFHSLKGLIFKVNETITRKAETNGLKAALKLSTLHTLILQDAFGRTASKAAASVEECKTADADEEERQVMLKELDAYRYVSFVEMPSGSLPPGTGLRLRFPSLIEGWANGSTMLIMDVFAHRAAIQAVQEKYFHGHPILFRDVEIGLGETIRAIEEAVATFNEYLKTRKALFQTEWDQEERGSGVPSAGLGEREGHLAIDIEGIQGRVKDYLVDHIVDEWVRNAKHKAIADILQETREHEAYVWRTLREQVGVEA